MAGTAYWATIASLSFVMIFPSVVLAAIVGLAFVAGGLLATRTRIADSRPLLRRRPTA